MCSLPICLHYQILCAKINHSFITSSELLAHFNTRGKALVTTPAEILPLLKRKWKKDNRRLWMDRKCYYWKYCSIFSSLTLYKNNYQKYLAIKQLQHLGGFFFFFKLSITFLQKKSSIFSAFHLINQKNKWEISTPLPQNFVDIYLIMIQLTSELRIVQEHSFVHTEGQLNTDYIPYHGQAIRNILSSKNKLQFCSGFLSICIED